MGDFLCVKIYLWANNTKEFANNYFEFKDILQRLDDDFYTTGKFKKYQKAASTVVQHMNFRKKITIYEFDETREDYNFKLKREYYYDVKSFTYLDKYYNLMFSPKEFNKIGSTQE